MTLQNRIDEVNDWQTLYLDTRALRRMQRQLFLIGVPLLLISVWVALIVQFLLSSVAISIVVSIALILLGILYLSNIGRKFVTNLYYPSMGADVRSHIWNRMSGWQGTFQLRNFLVINSTKLVPSDHWSTWLGGPVYLVIFDGFAVYLEKGNCFSRVVGAGFPMPYLDARETIKTIVDMRPQTRDFQVKAWTKDGIQVTLKVRIEFQIDPGSPKKKSDDKLIYPFNPRAVRKAVEYTALRIRDGKVAEADWSEGTQGKVTGILAHHISSHHLDELFLTDKGSGQILSDKVVNQLHNNLDSGLKDFGVSLKGFQITEIVLPEEVRRQRLDRWGADKDNLVSRISGETQAYGIRVNEATRAKAQHDLIVSIAKNLQAIDQEQFPEPLLFSLSSLIDQSLADPFIRTYLANETLTTLKRLREII